MSTTKKRRMASRAAWETLRANTCSNLSLARDSSDNDSQSSARPTKVREGSPLDDHHGPIAEGAMGTRTPPIPAIIVSMDSTSDVGRTSTTSSTLDEPMSNDTRSPRSEISTDDESPARTLNLEIHRLMKKPDGRYYISKIDLMGVTSQEKIFQIIMEDPSIKHMDLEKKEAFAQKVQQTARTLMALCVYARMVMRCLKKLLDRSLSDESLPLDDRHCCHENCGAAFRDLLAKQGNFMAPVFNTGEHKKLPSCVVLPIHFVPKVGAEHSTPENSGCVGKGGSSVSETEEQVLLRQKTLACCGAGAYSRVYRVRIHPDHHEFSEDRNCLFALKEFKDQPQIRDDKFEQERKILDELRKLTLKHIVVHYATWTQDQKYYMLFPYAECNLREYMEQEQFGACTKSRILWFLRQIRNLADALRNIHNITEVSLTSTNLASPNQGSRKSAWHHDVKPQNILFFKETGSKKGRFKIADFGSGKVHTLRSGSANTNSPNGTVTYEPPEAQLGEMATSRPYDIWSLGCVLLELLLWAILGFGSVQTFADERKGRSFPDSETNILVDDAFWERKSDVSRLRDAVTEKLRLLEKNVLEQESQPFKEVVELIWQMLDTNPRTRIVALDLWNRLDGIYRQKKVDLSVIDDDSLPRPADPSQSMMPRLSHQADDRPESATLTSSSRDRLPILSHPISSSHLRTPPG